MKIRTFKVRNARVVCLSILRVMFYWPFRLLSLILEKIRYGFDERRHEILDPEIYEDCIVQQELSEVDRHLEFCQYFPITESTGLGIQFVDRCPEETAHVVVVGETSFSPVYKRKVYYEKGLAGRRYIKLNNQKYLLDDSKTTPIDPITKKRGN